MKLFDKLKNELMFNKIQDLLTKDYKQINLNENNKKEIYKMIKFVYMYYYYFSKFDYIRILKKRWNLDKFKEKYPEDYNNYLEFLKKINSDFFVKYYWYNYNELLENWKLFRISTEILEFFYIKVDGKIFDDFVEFIWRDYEFFIYSCFDNTLNNKLLYNRENNVKDDFLEAKMKEYSKRWGDYNMIVL